MAAKAQDDVNSLAREYQQSLMSAAEGMRHAADLAEKLALAVGGGSLPTLHGEEPNGKRKRGEKKLKDPNAPKRPASAYILFQNEVRKGLKEKFPDVPNGELMKRIAAEWDQMDEKSKEPYAAAVAARKEEYDAAKAIYDARSPEEVAAGDAAAVAAAESKKVRKPRAPKEPKVETAVAAPKTTKKPTLKTKAATPPVVNDSTSEASTDEEEDDDEPPPPPAKKQTKPASKAAKPVSKSKPASKAKAAPASSEESSEGSESEEEEPPLKKTKSTRK